MTNNGFLLVVRTLMRLLLPINGLCVLSIMVIHYVTVDRANFN